jgi:hypothetical protein
MIIATAISTVTASSMPLLGAFFRAFFGRGVKRQVVLFGVVAVFAFRWFLMSIHIFTLLLGDYPGFPYAFDFKLSLRPFAQQTERLNSKYRLSKDLVAR